MSGLRLLSALQSLDQAIKRDPDFVSAYCYIARANDLLYFFDLDPTPDRIHFAEAAVKAALRLRPTQPKRILRWLIFCSAATVTTRVP